MKKTILTSVISLFFTTNILAQDCKISSSPAPSINDVRGTDAIALSISHVYYDEEEKMQIKSYQDAYIDFFKQATNYIKKDCKEYKMTEIYNFNINSMVDGNYYYFNATWDFN